MWEFWGAVDGGQLIQLAAVALLVATFGIWLARWASDLIDTDSVGHDPVELEQGHAVDPQLGALLLRRLLDAKWIHRRVERATFVNDSRLRRHLSFDLEVPEEFFSAHHDKEFRRVWSVVPLAFLRKREFLSDHQLLRKLDICDESLTSLPFLSHYENALASWSLLATAVAAGANVSVTELSSNELNIIWMIAASPSREAFGEFETLVERSSHDDTIPNLSRALDDVTVRYLLRRLSQHYLLIVELGLHGGLTGFRKHEPASRHVTELGPEGAETASTPVEGHSDLDFRAHGSSGTGQRRILKVSYDDRLPRGGWDRLKQGPLSRDFWDALGLVPKRFFFELGTPLPSRGVHFTIESPGEVKIVHAQLTSRTELPDGQVAIQRAVDNRLRQFPSVAHLHLGTPIPVSDMGSEVHVVAKMNLAVISAAIAPIILTIGLWFGAEYAQSVVLRSRSIQSLLLVIPIVMAGFAFAKQRDHLLARVSLMSRLLSAVTIGLSIAAAVVLVTFPLPTGMISIDHDVVKVVSSWWRGLARFSLFVACSQLAVIIFPQISAMFISRRLEEKSV